MKIKEHGNAFKDETGMSSVESIQRDDLYETLQYISNTIGLPMKSEKSDNGKIVRYGIEDLLLGSCAKSTDGMFGKKYKMNDIDMAIDESVYSYDEFVSRVVQKIGSDCVGQLMKGMGVIPTKFPIRGDAVNGYVQVDFIIGNPELLLFTYQSPDYIMKSSSYSGAYRNILLFSLLQNMRRQVRDDNTQEIIALVGPSLLLNKGIIMQWRHFPLRKDGNGRVKTMKSISRDEFKKLYPKEIGNETEMILSKPKDILNYIFPKASVTVEDIDSFEGLRDQIIKNLPDQAENIFNRLIANLQSRDMEIPPGLIVESVAKLEGSILLNEVRKYSLAMVTESVAKPGKFEEFRNKCIELINEHKKIDHFTKPKINADVIPQDGYYYLINKCAMTDDWQKISSYKDTTNDAFVNNLCEFYKEFVSLITSDVFFFVVDHYKLKITPESFIIGLIDLEYLDEN